MKQPVYITLHGAPYPKAGANPPHTTIRVKVVTISRDFVIISYENGSEDCFYISSGKSLLNHNCSDWWQVTRPSFMRLARYRMILVK